MADPTPVHARLSALAAALDALAAALAPLFATPPSTLARDLPPRDAARLHILAAYAPESLLFNAVRLAAAGAAGGAAPAADADEVRKHPVVAELQRVRGYSARLRDAEAVQRGPALRVDREAAARFVRAGISAPPEQEGREASKGAAGEAPAGAGAAKRGGEEIKDGEGGSPRGKKQRRDERRDGGTFIETGQSRLISYRSESTPQIEKTAKGTEGGVSVVGQQVMTGRDPLRCHGLFHDTRV
jgi:hypothetical protein